MERQRKRWLSNKEKDQIWQRWRQGESLSEIGRGLERNASGIFHVVAKNGGIAPLRRKRSALALTAAEREEISRGLKGDESIRQIAAGLGRAPSTISREINRNGGAQKYRAGVAEANAWTRALRPKTCALASNGKRPAKSGVSLIRGQLVPSYAEAIRRSYRPAVLAAA